MTASSSRRKQYRKQNADVFYCRRDIGTKNVQMVPISRTRVVPGKYFEYIFHSYVLFRLRPCHDPAPGPRSRPSSLVIPFHIRCVPSLASWEEFHHFAPSSTRAELRIPYTRSAPSARHVSSANDHCCQFTDILLSRTQVYRQYSLSES